MKITRTALFLSVLTTAGFLLTACNNEVVNVTDKNGKSISVSTPGDDTYTFKLTSEQLPDVSEEETSVEETEPEEANSVTTVSSTGTGETEQASEGPKTGEP